MFKKIFAIIALAFTLCSTIAYAGDDSSKLQVSGSEQHTIASSFNDTYKIPSFSRPANLYTSLSSNVSSSAFNNSVFLS